MEENTGCILLAIAAHQHVLKQQCNNKNLLLSFTVSVRKGFESSSLGGPGSRSPQSCSQRSAGAAAIWSSDCGWRTRFQGGSLTGLAKSMLAVGRKIQFLSMWASPQGSISRLMARQLASPKENDPRDWGGCSALYDRALELTHHHFIHVLLVTRGQPWFVVQNDYTQACRPAVKDPWRSSRRLVTACTITVYTRGDKCIIRVKRKQGDFSSSNKEAG